MKTITKNFISIFVLSVAVFFLGFATAKMLPGTAYETAPTVKTEPFQTDKPAEKVSVMVDFGDGRIFSSSEIVWQEGESVFDALKLYDDKASFGIKSKDYGGDLGVFVEEIGGKQDPSKKAWWQYWVNNEYGKIGASSYKLKPGDVVMWKLTSGQQ
ncbi:DUF4430 domain-containing protein [Candidatus Uhrbacteria bacterium]|nr:DUF4430 domain-containing protein [Candidatus Uhrbacteria bacterium]